MNSGFLAAFLFLAVISVFSYRNTTLLVDNAKAVDHTQEVLETTVLSLSEMKDLETGQRGFIITGADDYLEPYTAALTLVDSTLDKLQQLTADSPERQKLVDQLRVLKNQKVEELNYTIKLRKEKGFGAALKEVETNKGKTFMDDFRKVTAELKNEETKTLALRTEKVTASTQITMWIIVLGGLCSLLVVAGAAIVINIAENERATASRKLQEQNTIRDGLMALSGKMVGEQSVATLAQNVIETLANFVNAKVGAIYLADETGLLKQMAGFAFQAKTGWPTTFKFGEGLVGQAALQQAPIALQGTPDHYLKISSGLGETPPKFIQITPFLHDGKVKGVAEMGFLEPPSEVSTEYLNSSLDRVALAFNSAQVRAKVQELLQESQALAEELQVQQEELKSANEELEEKTQELETQQEELRQTNEELEEQRSALEEQTQKLEENNRKIESASAEIEEKAKQVEMASKYKSEFLANMSHELRTPLNSILILSKSLAENSEGNLTAEQREISRTVYSSGADLLSLINDILDLSKVEAGKLEVKPADTETSELAGSMESQFAAQMREKSLSFAVEIAKDCPRVLLTDRLRVEQILKNFLSNALKFTEKGKVTLTFQRPAANLNLTESGLKRESSMAITVTDTGIGIPQAKLNKIFEAFEQVDGTTSRKYSGTGLGLTIAKKLAHLLGGEIQVESKLGEGSRFSLIVPERLEKEVSVAKTAYEAPPPPAAPPTKRTEPKIDDDRKNLSKGDKTLLIVEDDPVFTKILRDLCRKKNFKCLVASDGESGVIDANEFLPSAVILDLRLPGMSGIAVLSSLKGNAKTRHIPVHVMSVDERANDVMKMGAVGFLSKPADKNEINGALAKIEDWLSAKAKKVLVVEDKKAERESIRKLIGDGSVQTIDVDSGSEAIKKLKAESFDCMILDLSLPDMTGFDLLEKMQQDETLSRPPVIVHTAKDLSSQEVEKLRAFSESIIVKGVKSEERLLDEVTLFLHRVESELPKEKQMILEKVRHREEIFENKKVLVVDDDMRNVFALRSVLSKKGFEIFVAKTGKEALAVLDSNPAMDVVLMDIMMPEMDGFEATRLIRRQPRFDRLPIITLTAKAMASDREKCLEAGASDYLSKPIDTDSLLSLLRVWLTR